MLGPKSFWCWGCRGKKIALLKKKEKTGGTERAEGTIHKKGEKKGKPKRPKRKKEGWAQGGECLTKRKKREKKAMRS